MKLHLLFSAFIALSFANVASAQTLRALVQQSTEILAERQGSADPIPQAAINNARGVAILSITKGGLVFGGLGGDGVVLIKNAKGWSAPIPIRLSGASFGAQIGGSNTRTITLLNTAQAVRSFTNPGRLAWNARAAGTAGQDAVQEQEGGLLADQDVTIYSATTGLFGGATFGGSQLSINDQMLRNAYGPNVFIRDIIEGKVKAPDYAARLINLLNGKR